MAAKSKHDINPLSQLDNQINRCRLSGCDPRNYRNQWLETLNDTALNRLRCYRCILRLSEDSKLLNSSQLPLH